MKEKLQAAGRLQLGQELSKTDQKKIMGGWSQGYRCNSMPPGQCSTAPIDWAGYCRAVWNSGYSTCSLP